MTTDPWVAGCWDDFRSPSNRPWTSAHSARRWGDSETPPGRPHSAAVLWSGVSWGPKRNRGSIASRTITTTRGPDRYPRLDTCLWSHSEPGAVGLQGLFLQRLCCGGSEGSYLGVT